MKRQKVVLTECGNKSIEVFHKYIFDIHSYLSYNDKGNEKKKW